ncbi:MAG: PilN domain-containing protein [Gemmatimonadaceae bacterium]|nr:PilN domain-containing protein [Gemmatimonadaceae bacterium]
MMIQINLLPGAKKSSGRSERKLDVGAAFGGLSDKIRDPWMLSAVAGVAIAVAAVGGLFVTQQARAAEVNLRVERAVRDSTKMANVLLARRKLSSQRDSVSRQLSIIRQIDDSRYTWAHLLDEISRALPAYTWLVSIQQTSDAPMPPTAKKDSAAAKPQPAAKARTRRAEQEAAARADSVAKSALLRFKVVGQTVDIQALTLFMKQLESSPYVQHVQLARSEIVGVDGKDITEFQLDAEYEKPAPGVARTVPLVVPVR